jgi:hypothetical protein
MEERPRLEASWALQCPCISGDFMYFRSKHRAVLALVWTLWPSPESASDLGAGLGDRGPL